MDYIDTAIAEHGIDTDDITGDKPGYLRSGNLPALKKWAKQFLETGELLLVDKQTGKVQFPGL